MPMPRPRACAAGLLKMRASCALFASCVDNLRALRLNDCFALLVAPLAAVLLQRPPMAEERLWPPVGRLDIRRQVAALERHPARAAPPTRARSLPVRAVAGRGR